MGCHLSVKISPEIREVLRKMSPSASSRTSPSLHGVSGSYQRSPNKQLFRGTGGSRPRFDSHFSTEKIAIIVGINAYNTSSWVPLDTAESDAKSMAEYFAKEDFKVTLLTGSNATKEKIEQSLQQINLCKTCVFYFAGHGIQGKNGPALVPFEGSFHTHETHDKITQDFLKGWSSRTPAHGVCFILDCCFGGDFCCDLKLRSGERPSFCLNQKEKSRIILSASLKGERVPDADENGVHSPFTGALLESLQDECFSGSVIELFVATRARCRVQPWCRIVPKLGRMIGDEGGDVFL